MKKVLKIVLILLLITITSTRVFADDNLIINKNIVDSTLLENGDLRISQDITYDFKDKYNGIYWNIGLKDTDGISDVKVYEIIDGGEIEFSQNPEAKKGDNAQFKSTETKDNIELMIFSPAKDETKTFRIQYLLKNVAIRHSDSGELYYQFLGKENEEKINYFSANIELPSLDKDKVKIFAHGPLNGTIQFADNNQVKLEVDNVPPNTFIEARIFFPLDYISASVKTGNKTLNALMDEELSYIQNIEEQKVRKENTKSALNLVSGILSAIGAAMIYFFFHKFKRNPDIYEEMDSLVPEDISPAELKIFMTSFLDGRALIATLFDLSRREFITIDNIEVDEEPKKGIFGGSKEPQENYSFNKTSLSLENLLPHESFFMDWLFNHIGNGDNVTTMDIDHYRKKQSSAFSKNYNKWSSLVKEDLKSRNYYDERGKKYLVFLIIPAVLFLVLGTISIVFSAFIGVILIVVSLAMFFMSIAMATRKSDKGFIQHGLWKDFMKEMTVFEDLDIDIPRDKYLIAAIALGITMNKMNEYRENVAYGYYPMYWGAFYYGGLNKSGGSKFEDSLNSSFYGSTGTSTSTSSSGAGGGFSGGGGGGAGGGGGGGGF